MSGRNDGNPPDETFHFDTRSVHAGARPDPHTGARTTPIYQTTSYVFDDVDQPASLFNLQTFGNIYSRLTNPTVAVLEERIANLEGGRAACACASGHAAQFLTFFTLLEPATSSSPRSISMAARSPSSGRASSAWAGPVISSIRPGRRTSRQRSHPGPRRSMSRACRIPVASSSIWRPRPDIAHRHGIPLIVDNTMASPYLCRPFEWGADIVTHSLTKFLGGHGNSLGGVLVESGRFNWAQNDKFPTMTTPTEAYHGITFYETFGDFAFTMKARAVALRDFGPSLSPTNAFHLITGIETLPLRMERHAANALAVARFLEDHPAVSWVSHAGLESSPYHDLARKYMPLGVGPVFTFGLKGGFDAGVRLVESCELISHLANVGDTRSLILHPASTTHRQLTDEQRVAAGAGNDVVRISVGIEHAGDIIADLDQALARI